MLRITLGIILMATPFAGATGLMLAQGGWPLVVGVWSIVLGVAGLLWGGFALLESGARNR
jgi:hypothetical protein